MSKIIKLSAENVKRLRAVEIKPDGSAIVISGRNGQGKSSVLDAIQYALGGDPDAKMPVRRGEDKAKIVVDLGDVIVRRTFTAAGGTTLTVTNADGVKQMSPQAILDKLVGKLTFDPLAFSREKPKDQADTLRRLVGLDFTAQDAERQKLFDDRTAVNRDAKSLESRIAGMPKHENVGKEESTADILKEQEEASRVNSRNAEVRSASSQLVRELGFAENAVANKSSDIKSTEAEIDRLAELLKKQRSELAPLIAAQVAALEKVNKSKADVAALKDVDLSPFATRCQKVEENNRKVRESNQREELVKQYKAKIEQSEKLTEKMNDLDSAKRKATTDAKYPVDGLMFDTAGGVTLNGIPFDQCSSAEQLRVSVAVGLALNPKLRILLIRDGSLLDDDAMKAVLEMASRADAQVWIERVESDAHTSVVIEDGSIVEEKEANE